MSVWHVLFWILIGVNIGVGACYVGWLNELFEELGPPPWRSK